MVVTEMFHLEYTRNLAVYAADTLPSPSAAWFSEGTTSRPVGWGVLAGVSSTDPASARVCSCPGADMEAAR
jgi:hypothetical protein